MYIRIKFLYNGTAGTYRKSDRLYKCLTAGPCRGDVLYRFFNGLYIRIGRENARRHF